MKLRIAGIVRESVVDGPGIRYVIFTQGCFHNCPGCHNPETHDINGGYYIDVDEIIQDIKKNPYIKAVTFSGGEPFIQPEPLAYMAEILRNLNYNIMSYTGYTFEELMENNNEQVRKLLRNIDMLVDGKFKMEERDISLKYRGSRNQRVIDVKKSLESGSVVLLYE